MKIENYEHFIKVIADTDMRLTNKDRTIFVEYLYLGKGDSPENYTEVGKEIWLPLAKDKTTEQHLELIGNTIDKIDEDQTFQDLAIDSTMVALMETFDMVLFLLENVELSKLNISDVSLIKNIIVKGGVSKMVDFYVVAIQRGLKTIDDVPKMYKAQVQAMLEALA